MRLAEVDKRIWTIARYGTFVSADTWNHLRRKKATVSWWPLVWHPHAIPKQAFILWLAIHNQLNTGDRLLSRGFKCDTECVFCRHGMKAEITCSLSVGLVFGFGRPMTSHIAW